MAKYTKHNSNYIRTGKHMTLKGGDSLFEKDWVTFGQHLRFGKGKIPYYTDGNFIFTTSPTPSYHKKHDNGVDYGEYTYDDVKDATSAINEVNVDEQPSQDIRSYVCYGSCFELVRVTVENILKTFPGCIKATQETLNGEYILDNPFGYDLIMTDIDDNVKENIGRYLAFSYEDFTLNGSKITSWKPSGYKGQGKGWKCDEYDVYGKPIVTVTVNSSTINGYQVERNLVFTTKTKDFVIRPNEDVVEEYFRNLKGFEKCLLNRNTNPLYTNTFITPIEYEHGYSYVKRTYTWPSDSHDCIDASSVQYIDFINKLSNLAQLYDELWTDNVWRRMTHEAIKNYDWTYTREYEEGDEQENIDGGERMHKVLNVIGRTFDDVKRYIDLAKHANKNTYDNDRNMSSALISDKLELNGIEPFSTIPMWKKCKKCGDVMFDGNTKICEKCKDKEGEELEECKDEHILYSISDEKLSKSYILDEKEKEKWYPTQNLEEIDFAKVDIEFMRRLLLSSKHILKTKGTRNSINMIMGMFGYGEDKDYTITEQYHTVEPIDYDKKLTGLNDSFGDTIVKLNTRKNLVLEYPEDNSGIPVGYFDIKGDRYLIPYYDNKKVYDGGFYFQSKGNWFEETISYLHVVGTVGDLFNINPNLLSEGDIYYVVNVYDFVNYSEDTDVLYSNYFVVKNEYITDRLRGWRSVDLNNEKDEYSEKANYLNTVIPDNIGNNPHVGYGRIEDGGYDEGKEFIEYMEKPFKYAIDKNTFDTSDKDKADKIEFKVSDPVTTTESIEKFKDDFLIHNGDLRNEKQEKNTVINNMKEKYYINSKVVTITNNIDNDFYKKYFKQVIVKYLMQVIPSTTIIKLVDFE